jgi:peptidylprolyl isomerase
MRDFHSATRDTEKMRTIRFRSLTIAFAVAVATVGVLAFVAPSGALAQTAGKTMTTPSGLQIIDSTVGTGASPKPGQICVMHYTGWLYEDGKKGKKFDSSVDRNEPFEFPIGQHRVIAGWDEGVATMKVGGKRTLIIPPALGYGARGAGGVIPPNATLMFDVELLGVK